MTRSLPSLIGPRRFWAVLLASMLLVGLLPGAVLGATPIVTAATGGAAISADTAVASPGNGAYTNLTGPAVTEPGAGDLSAGTIVLDAPSGFEFNAGAGTAGRNAGCTLVLDSVVVTTSSVTLTISGSSTGTACVLTFTGLRVRPTVGTPLQGGSIGNSGSGTGAPASGWGTLQEVQGAPVLSFQTEPSTTAAAATAFAQQPAVLDKDKFDNPRTADSITLAITTGTGQAGAALTCTTNPLSTNVSGVYTFAGCKIDKSSPSAYTLRATSNAGGTSATSTSISITPGAADHLGFSTQPAGGVPGTAFATQPQVSVLDGSGNVVFNDGGHSITLTIGTNPGSGTLTCTANPAATSSGIAAFAGCRINNVGVGYTLHAASSGLTAADSSAFDVSDRLIFTTQPSATTSAGVAFASQPVVAVRAGASNTSTHDQATVVTLSIKPGTGPAGATLSCDTSLSRTVVNGVATFTGCKIDKVSLTGNPYAIRATATNLTLADSGNVAITAGPATKLGFTSQPTVGVAAQAFAIQPVVAVQDAGGNTVTSGTNSNATVTLALGPGAPAGSILTCTGGLSKAAVAGVASFAGCAINAAGTFTLVASAAGLTGATSNSFVVTAPVAAITLTNSASVITWGNAVGLTVQFGTNGANKTFALQVARDGITWSTVANLTTNASGLATFAYRPATNDYYRVVFAGTLDLGAANSNTTRTVVRQVALLRPHHSSVTSIARNSSITFTTTVRPARPELAPAKVSFVFYRRIGSVWTFVTKRDVFIDSAGVASTTFKFTRAGSWYVRSIANPTTYNANSVWSPLERYLVS